MGLLKKGKKGKRVEALQKLLVENGVLTPVNGIFDSTTDYSVRLYQSQLGLTEDGIVGQTTWQLLNKNSINQLESHNKIDKTSYVLTTEKYFPFKHNKKSIVLHHTNGWTVKRDGTPSMNHFDWWNQTDGQISTPYSIDYDGNIYEHYDPEFWAYHLGLGSANKKRDQESIGIELVNEGQMSLDGDQYYWHLDSKKLKYNRPADKPVNIPYGWRDHYYFAPYSEKQVQSTIWLTNYLCEKFFIEKETTNSFGFMRDIIYDGFEGVYTHINVRKYYPEKVKGNKWDLSPAFDYEKFTDQLKSDFIF